jgi:TonB family protein
MFAQLQIAGSRRRTSLLTISLGFHCCFLLWILHDPGAMILAPSSVVAGNHGHFVAHVYWPSRPFDTGSGTASATSDAAQQQQKTSRTPLTWRQPSKSVKKPAQQMPLSKVGDNSTTNAARQASPPRPSGSPYGSVLEGSLTGDEIRPALPVVSHDPVVDSADLSGREGDVVVEITIDAQGNIIQKVVIQSLSPIVDQKVLAALENWRFRPATQNGVAIPSKQDVYYHFKSSRG